MTVLRFSYIIIIIKDKMELTDTPGEGSSSIKLLKSRNLVLSLIMFMEVQNLTNSKLQNGRFTLLMTRLHRFKKKLRAALSTRWSRHP